jgi:hypothetical protein
MGQLLLPIFPNDTKMINSTLGVREHKGIVIYFHCGVPIYSHESADLSSFRFITSNFIKQGRCTIQEIADTFYVSFDSASRWKKQYEEKGECVFFNAESRHGRSHKLLPHVLERIQVKLNTGQSVNSIAKNEAISEGSIRYAISQGRLKKTFVKK